MCLFVLQVLQTLQSRVQGVQEVDSEDTTNGYLIKIKELIRLFMLLLFQTVKLYLVVIWYNDSLFFNVINDICQNYFTDSA